MSVADFSRQVKLTTESGESFLVSPLASGDAHRLGTAFAEIDPWAAYGYAPETLAKFLAASEPGAPRIAFIAGGNAVGAAVVRPGWLRGPYLQFLALLPEAQGRGIGSAFLSHMESEARGARERNLWVAASEINTGAIRLYARHGFTRIADLDDLAWDGRTEILFRKRLT